MAGEVILDTLVHLSRLFDNDSLHVRSLGIDNRLDVLYLPIDNVLVGEVE